ncbi:MAG: effector binding domain-containing protein, partial [Legionella sp.]
MQSIQPLMKHIEGFSVKGVSARTQNSDEFDEKKAKLPKLWQQFYAADLATNQKIFGVYSDYDSDANGLYTVTVGIASDETSSAIKVSTGNYLVFQAKGPMPAIVIK